MVSRLRSGPKGWELGLKAGVWVSRMGFGPQGWDLGLKDGIWASWLDLSGGGVQEEEEVKNSPYL